MTAEAWAAWAHDYALPIIGLIIGALLFEIRAKLEAIRFMMERDFDERHAPRYDEDGEMMPRR